MNVQTAFQKAYAHLSAQHLTSASLDVEVLLMYTLKKDRRELYLNWQQLLTPAQEKKFFALIQARANHQPIAYLTGHREFYGLDFAVNSATLIPRCETEIIVEVVINLIKTTTQRITLIDLGTGSGCIPISIYKNLQEHERSRIVTIIANDISAETLKIARNNARRHQVTMRFIVGDLSSVFTECPTQEKIIITANLPYVSQKEKGRIPRTVQAFEPHQALFAADQGLREIKKAIQHFFLLPILQPAEMILEMDPSQIPLVHTMTKAMSPRTHLQVFQDLAGRKRALKITRYPQP